MVEIPQVDRDLWGNMVHLNQLRIPPSFNLFITIFIKLADNNQLIVTFATVMSQCVVTGGRNMNQLSLDTSHNWTMLPYKMHYEKIRWKEC